MDLENIKRGLRAEIKKRENEQYLTFQCNVRQMCKDVLAKLEEQESEIAELNQKLDDYRYTIAVLRKEKSHNKFKRCLAMAGWCITEYIQSKCLDFTNTEQWYWRRWHIRWRELAKEFKPNNKE